MDLVAIGGDRRYAHMVREAIKNGVSAAAFGLERSGLFDVPEIDVDQIGDAECVVMPNPFGGQWKMPLSGKNIGLNDILNNINKNATLILFGSGKVPQSILDAHEVVFLDEDEILMTELARQTAEGAIHSVCERAAYELYRCRALIIGYGRIGKALHRILNGYQASVAVVARRKSAQCEAAVNSALAMDFSNFEQALALSQIIFSTPPERVLDARLVQLINRNALLVDLSSRPFGVDMDAAEARWLHAWREPSLPGRYCPQSAGRSMLDAVLRVLNEECERL
ncbi:MAG: NAD(P)-dependent oxidoreductase [Clostridia bacterium]|nr:NAD(P)-dependent oxidoreductase [Clostridia bacterium]